MKTKGMEEKLPFRNRQAVGSIPTFGSRIFYVSGRSYPYNFSSTSLAEACHVDVSGVHD
jgi:hypothetical protein